MTHDPTKTCCHCGDPAVASIFEAWGHDFMIEACCEAQHAALAQALSEGGAAGAALLREIGAADLLPHDLRGVGAEGPGLELDYRLEIRPVRQAVAKAFVRDHHHHCRPPAGWRFGAGCYNGRTLVGVAMVGRPVARRIDAARVVEVNRLCIDRSLSAALRRNAASKLYGYAAREARRRGFARIITYTLESESGISLRASGWTEDGRSAGGSWSRPSRARDAAGPTEPKIRWARDLAPSARTG